MGGVEKIVSMKICRRKLDVNNDQDQERQQQQENEIKRERKNGPLIELEGGTYDRRSCAWIGLRVVKRIVTCGGCDGFCRVYSISDGEVDSGEFCSDDYPIPFDQVMR